MDMFYQYSGRFGFPIGKILEIFNLQVAPILYISFESNCFSVQEKKFKI